MLIRIILLIFIISCTKPKISIIPLNSQKTYSQVKAGSQSCRGTGIINSYGELEGKLKFTFKSKKDSTFMVFNDLIGRKTLMVWVTNQKITARDLVKNEHYDYNKIKTLFPIVEYINPIDLTKLIWGVQPEYKNKRLKNVDIDFEREKDSDGFYNVTNAMYYNKDTNHGFKINITSRNKNNSNIDMKKVWKLLKY